MRAKDIDTSSTMVRETDVRPPMFVTGACGRTQRPTSSPKNDSNRRPAFHRGPVTRAGRQEGRFE
jgi:hypothetical protein